MQPTEAPEPPDGRPGTSDGRRNRFAAPRPWGKNDTGRPELLTGGLIFGGLTEMTRARYHAFRYLQSALDLAEFTESERGNHHPTPPKDSCLRTRSRSMSWPSWR